MRAAFVAVVVGFLLLIEGGKMLWQRLKPKDWDRL